MRIWVWILVRLIKSQKVEFLHEKYTYSKVGTGNRVIGQKTYLRRYKSLFLGRNPRFISKFGQLPWSWIRIRIPNTDPAPGHRNHCWSGSATLMRRSWVRLRDLSMHVPDPGSSFLYRSVLDAWNCWLIHPVLRIRDVYPGSRIPDPDFYPSRIPNPGSRISDPGSRIQKQQQKREVKKNKLSYLFMEPQISQNCKLF